MISNESIFYNYFCSNSWGSSPHQQLLSCISCWTAIKIFWQGLNGSSGFFRSFFAWAYDTYLANLFSEVKGITIEKFYLTHKIEKVKVLIVYDELNLSEIAFKMHYSSVAHLSAQFKKYTGLTPTHFKNLKNKRNGTLENV